MKISVTVLVYNSEAHLAQALDGLKKQTMTDFEVILFDDHSTDSSGEICQHFAKTDQRFRHVLPAHRLGLQASRSAVLSECQGDYIAVLDSDDLTEPTRLERQLAAITSTPGITLVTSLCGRVDDLGRKTNRAETPHLDAAGLRWRLIFGNSIFHSSAFFSRDLALAVGGYDPTLTTCEDADLYGRLLQHGEAFCVNSILTYWRVHPNNISRGIDHYKIKRRDALGVFQKLISSFVGIELDVDTTEALYAHVRSPVTDPQVLLKAIDATVKSLDVFLTHYSRSNALKINVLKKSALREALLSLADLREINRNEKPWATVEPAWKKAVTGVLKLGRPLRYRWFTDTPLFFPRRQLRVSALIALLRCSVEKGH